MKYKVFGFKEIWMVCLCICLGIVQAGYPQETTLPKTAAEESKPKNDKKITLLKKDVKILRNEIRKVRQSVSALKKETKSIKAIAQAVAELNSKLEAQIITVNSLTGEIYRIASVQENNLPKGKRNKENLENLDQEIENNKQSIKDIEDELKILRAVQADLQNQAFTESPDDVESSRIRKMFNWKYWGQTAFGVALVAFIIAL